MLLRAVVLLLDVELDTTLALLCVHGQEISWVGDHEVSCGWVQRPTSHLWFCCARTDARLAIPPTPGRPHGRTTAACIVDASCIVEQYFLDGFKVIGVEEVWGSQAAMREGVTAAMMRGVDLLHQ